jgi:hypothetical protein
MIHLREKQDRPLTYMEIMSSTYEDSFHLIQKNRNILNFIFLIKISAYPASGHGISGFVLNY